MKKVYGYIRVSHLKQEKGVSREAQQDAIEAFAEMHQLSIIKWYQETKSAAKTGRAEYNNMLSDLLSDKDGSTGVIIHKIDRSARNLDDWNQLSKLHSLNYTVHLVCEGLDLAKPSDAFSANIQACVAAHYSRNLSQEATKGLYQRLKQGIFPFRAPVGYLDTGKGNLKTPCPQKAPLIKKLFEYYIKEGYSVMKLIDVMYDLGLRNTKENKITKNGILTILKNPFYMGIMRVKGQTFQGKHEAIITSHQFKKAQNIIKGKSNTKIRKNRYLFSRKIYCAFCVTTKLVGELQKGRVYYRCQKKHCPTKTIREDVIENHLKKLLLSIELGEQEKEAMAVLLQSNQKEQAQDAQKLLQSIQLRLAHLKTDKGKLMDYLIQNIISTEDYQDKTKALNEQERLLLEQQHEVSSQKQEYFKKVEKFLELAQSLTTLYDLANHDEKRELLEIITSNCSVSGRKLSITMVSPFYELANRDVLMKCDLNQTTTLKKASTTVHTDLRTSLVCTKPLKPRFFNAFFALLLEKISSLPDLNLSHNYELPTNNSTSE